MDAFEILFGTSNAHKVKEAMDILGPHGFQIKQYTVDLLEIQDSDLEKIARVSLENLNHVEGPLFVEDTGLFIEALNGFPGPFASYVFKTLGNKGILKLLTGEINRKAYFESYIAFKDKNGTIFTFNGRCTGEISHEIKGKEWGYDPIFIPSESNPWKNTFAELDDRIKNKISHRSLALTSLKEFLLSV
jgi:XTP/dITP diphosphohydrolase